MTSRLYYFAGGGTGGHLFPGLAVATEIRVREPDARIVFIGSERSLEQDLVTRHGFEHLGLPSEPLTRLWRNPLAFLCGNWRAYRAAKRLIRKERPTAVVGLGGFASAPIVLAAHRFGVPPLLLEQNSIPGRSTRWLSRWANAVCLSYPASAAYFTPRVKTRLTGNPVRTQIVELATRFDAPKEDALGGHPPTLLVLGGSQGAQPLNEALLWLLEREPQLLTGWRIVHQTGTAQHSVIQHRYQELGIEAEVVAFIQDITERYRAATLVVSRAGATTLAELACAGLPAVLVPYPLAADNHQWHNARTFEIAGAASIVLQGATAEATGQVLLDGLRPPLAKPELLQSMSQAMRGLAHPRATDSVLGVLREMTSN